ncbi:hypothetical protein EKO27_g7674 [Xylaria grammica]|uniref:ADF-H domain-containing protein n=1 Tax=Xylaria grammica TaxID=363999 RepID=A0A439CZK2_9PEZI|nr:hypothetical protein EKO27_g7674 [Xylaria grammica]
MSGLEAPEILAAYDAVRSDKDETNWLLISYAGSKPKCASRMARPNGTTGPAGAGSSDTSVMAAGLSGEML